MEAAEFPILEDLKQDVNDSDFRLTNSPTSDVILNFGDSLRIYELFLIPNEPLSTAIMDDWFFYILLNIAISFKVNMEKARFNKCRRE